MNNIDFINPNQEQQENSFIENIELYSFQYTNEKSRHLHCQKSPLNKDLFLKQLGIRAYSSDRGTNTKNNDDIVFKKKEIVVQFVKP